MPAPDPALLELLDQVGLTRADVADLLAHTRDIVVTEAAEAAASPVPTVRFDQLDDLPGQISDSIRSRGCVVVQGVFDRAEADEWNREVGEYLATNDFERRHAERYPEATVDGSRIWGIYWSRPQVAARQHVRMARVRRFLNSFWIHESNGVTWFDPDHDIGYPDRLRRRRPGVSARGLAAHSDSPSSGGWRIPENVEVFHHVLAGRPEQYDPWDAAHRTSIDVRSPVSCTTFRTFQGWTALSEMRPSDGVLHLAGVPTAAAYLLVQGIAGELGLADDPVPAPRRARPDELVQSGLVPIPAVDPGDTVWWHGDIIHSVADATNEHRWGNVMYIGSAPRCPRNEVYAPSMLERFERGASPLDFPAEDFETDFVGRADLSDLSDLGRQQFGLEPIG
jgi:hypothetical protein